MLHNHVNMDNITSVMMLRFLHLLKSVALIISTPKGVEISCKSNFENFLFMLNTLLFLHF